MKQITLLKEKTEELLQNKSEKYVKVFFSFLEEVRKYFKKQSFFYINSLSNYPELKKTTDDDFLEKIKPLFEKIYNLGQKKQLEKLNENLKMYGYSDFVSKYDILIKNEEAIKYAENRAGEFIEGINQTTQKQISEIISNGIKESKDIHTIASEINNTFLNYGLFRATLIAQQETAMAYNHATRKMIDNFADDLDVEGWKRAVTQKDSSVRDSHRTNEAEGRIPKNQVFSTGHDNAPFGYFCRCDVIYSLVNPETGKLYDNEEYDFWGGYSDEQIEKFNENFGFLKKDFLDNLFIEGKDFIKKYNLTIEEAITLQSFSGNTYHSFNEGFFGKMDGNFTSGIKFFINALNKIENSSGTFFRGHKSYTKQEMDFLDKLQIGDIYENKHFFSSSEDKETGIDFMKKEKFGAVLFEINTKKAKKIKDISNISAENEFIFIPGQTFKVEKIDFFENDNKIYKKITLSDLN
ncbi:hypothetical protein DLH72_00860 [Candidatus Gracilibacteria bacterium]|nr:MAG: hypothetical protein DLH72_00860 [Candidatus Gracilibacteria bacterium]